MTKIYSIAQGRLNHFHKMKQCSEMKSVIVSAKQLLEKPSHLTDEKPKPREVEESVLGSQASW